jgi:hypothetical protein
LPTDLARRDPCERTEGRSAGSWNGLAQIEILSRFCEFSTLCTEENFASLRHADFVLRATGAMGFDVLATPAKLSYAFPPPRNRIPPLAPRAFEIDGRLTGALVSQGRASIGRDPDTEKLPVSRIQIIRKRKINISIRCGFPLPRRRKVN